MKIKDLILCSLFAALTAVLAQISIPFPGGVPLTLQTLAVSLAGILLGSKKAGISISIYVFLGAIGIPVFAGFSGGLPIIFGPTGGFILSFPIMGFLIGFICERNKNKFILFGAMILGSIVNYGFGTLQFSLITNSSLVYSFTVCVLPFLFTGVVKALLSTALGIRLKESKGLQGALN